jgi:hypothetical protein
VEQVNRQVVGRMAMRSRMVLLAGRSYRVPQIATIHDCGEDVVRLWLHRYQMKDVVAATHFLTEMTTKQPIFLPIAA